MTTTAQRATANTAAAARPAVRSPLRRACACGTHTPLGGECDSCKKKKVQAKFAVGAVNDAFEREADAVADQVMRGAPVGAAEPAPVRVQRQADRATDGADAPASVDAALGSGGAPLDARLRTDMEARFGHDFSHVRTHTDAATERSAHEIDAAAYTAGHHVVFGRGRYAPSTPGGRRLIAHELTHVLQQAPGVVRRQPAKKAPATKAPATKAPAAKVPTAADSPTLDFQPAKNVPPRACLVFIHHEEKNARVIAKNLYEFCKYNLAIVKPGGAREIKLPAHKQTVDPNALFPPRVTQACWQDDKPCRDTITANAGKTDEKGVRDYVESQFFIAVKDCSKNFTLPIVGLHNNSLDDTEQYRKDLTKTTGAPDLAKVEGKTFDKKLTTGVGAPADTLPYEEFKTWAKTLGATENREKKLVGGPFQPDKTNIFIWCQGGDNTKCHIGDPKHPDNVVWVTNDADFNALRKKKVNVVLQTQIESGGKSETDLSSLFVTLTEAVGTHYKMLGAVNQTIINAKLAMIPAWHAQFVERMSQLDVSGALVFWNQINAESAQVAALTVQMAKDATEQATKDQQRRFVNIETPPKTLLGEAGLVDSLNTVRKTLAAVGLDACDKMPAPGEAESAEKKLEQAVRAAATKPPKPKAAPKKKGKP